MAYRPLGNLPAASGLSALEQSGTASSVTALNPSAATPVVGAYRPLESVNAYAAGTPPPSGPVGDAPGNKNGAASAHPPPYQPPALAICTFTAPAAATAGVTAATPPHLTPSKGPGATATTPPFVRSPLPGYQIPPAAAVRASSPASIIPGLALVSTPAQHLAGAELASTGSGGGGRVSQTGLSTVGLPPALVAAKAIAAAAAAGGSGGGSRPMSTHPSRGASSDGMAQLLPQGATLPMVAAAPSQAGGYHPLLMAMSAGAAAAAAATTSRASTPPLAPQLQQPQPQPQSSQAPAAATTAVAASSPIPALPPVPQQQPALPGSATLAAPIQVPVTGTAAAPAPVRPVVSAAAPGVQLPTPVVVGRLPQPVVAAAAPVPIITSPTALQPPQTGSRGSGGDDAGGDTAAARRQLAIHLAEMMGEHVDVATCLDVLEQVGGDEGRATAALLDLCGGGAGGGGGDSSSGRLPGVAPPPVAAAAEDTSFGAGIFGASAEADGFFAAADGFGAAASGSSASAHGAEEGFLGMTAGFGEAAGGAAEAEAADATASTSAGVFDFASLAGGSPPLGQGAEHMRAALEAAGLSCDDAGLAQLYQQQEEIEEQRRRERLQQQVAADEVKVKELQQQEEEARAARGREQGEHVDAQAAAAAAERVPLGGEPDAGSAWGSSAASGGAATQATGCFGATDADDTDAFFLGPDDDEGAEKKIATMKIYFDKVYDEDALRFCLEACHGDMEMALEVLREQLVEALKKEQQEADEKYARALQQQHSSGGVALGAGGDSLLEDYIINAAEGLADVAEAQRSLEERQHAEAASRRGRLGSDAEGRNRLGLTVLRRQFPDAYNDGVVADALSNHSGDVEAARAALLAMGYLEAVAAGADAAPSVPVSAAQQRYPAPPQQQRRPDVAMAAAGVGARGGDEDDDGQALVSQRGQAQQWRLEGGGLPGNAAVLGPDRNAGANSAATQRAAQLAQLAAAFPKGDAAAALAAGAGAGAGAGGSQGHVGAACAELGDGDYEDEEGEDGGAGASTSTGPPGYRRLGPIKALASLGLDFDKLDVSDELRNMVRFAFKESGLPEVFRRQAEAEAAAAAQSSAASGRRMGYGLTHEEKQEVWATNRNLPRALRDMAGRLRRGGKEAYQAGDRRLAGEMKKASLEVERLEREANERAATRIYMQVNNSLQQQWNTDLHGLRPHEALKQLEDQLQRLSIMGGHVNWTIITGKGLHSDQTLGPVLPATVSDWLARKRLQALAAPGHYVVRLTPDVFERLAAEAGGGGPAGGGGSASGPVGASG
ncbi:hypothetical protein HXX76_000180 [Chlamydomonas incerta]|uniref:Smr domain-containing protein n=1 Tax=Chlamydomonas incerta TaxID=51695 RepID=A0A836B2L2_CHLIN|nr:hypothetical protein HXX76_000180 [Chlamydomonas incerta]|eukprot:KAG2445568.1 hypothetical protein HXX76_000180 [Chlamydomonas incerta]